MLLLPTCVSLATLGAPSPALDFDAEACMRLLPLDASVLLVAGDLSAALDEESAGSWAKALLDPRMAEMLREFTEIDADDSAGVDQLIFDIAHELTGAAVALGDEEWAVGVVDGGAGLIDAIIASIEGFGGTVSREDVLGAPGLVATHEDPSVVLMRSSDHGYMFAAGASHDEANALLEGVLAAAVENEAGAAPDVVTGTVRVADATLELFVDAAFATEDDPDMEGIEDHFGTVYFGAAMGNGNAGDMLISMSFKGEDAVEPFANALGTASYSRFDLAPTDAIACTAMHVDMLAMIDAVVAAMGDEVGLGMYENMMDGGNAALGLDIEEDLLANLTGDLTLIQFPLDVAGIEQNDPSAVIDAYGAMLLDIEDSEPFLDLMEALEGLVGPIATASDVGDAARWDFDVEGTIVSVWVQDDLVMLGGPAAVDAIASRMGELDTPGFVNEASFAILEADVEGFYAGVFDFDATMGASTEVFEIMSESDAEDMKPVFDALEIVDDYVDGLGFFEWTMTKSHTAMRLTTR